MEEAQIMFNSLLIMCRCRWLVSEYRIMLLLLIVVISKDLCSLTVQLNTSQPPKLTSTQFLSDTGRAPWLWGYLKRQFLR
jgi:hypothetical protein